MHKMQLKVLQTNKAELFTDYAKRREERRNYFNPAIRKKVLVILEELFDGYNIKKTNIPIKQ